MQIITKRIKVIQMTREEHESFMRTMERASEGHTAHYAEERLNDGSFLGVSIVGADEQKDTQERERIKRQQERDARYGITR
jgi:hypothetical protein